MADEAIVGRRTPYEVVFGAPAFEERHFPAISEEAETRGLSADRREQFVLLARAGAVLQDLVPDGVEATALGPYMDALFHAYQFWRSGRVVYALEREVGVSLVESPPAFGDAPPCVPAPAFYLELPARLFWGRVAEGEPPEPLEGMYVRAERDPDDRVQGADLLIVYGMHPQRAGFSAVAIGLEGRDLEAPVPEDAFRSRIPGADLAGLYSVERRIEAVLLLARALRYMEEHAGAVIERGGAGSEAAADRGGRTALGHYRVRTLERNDT